MIMRKYPLQDPDMPAPAFLSCENHQSERPEQKGHPKVVLKAKNNSATSITLAFDGGKRTKAHKNG